MRNQNKNQEIMSIKVAQKSGIETTIMTGVVEIEKNADQ